MKINVHDKLLNCQSYSCINCGHGCKSFMVPVTIKEQQSIMDLENWFSTLNTDALFVNISAPGFPDGALAKRADKSCVFLDEDQLCLIHKKYGFQSKPKACQLFPYVLTPFDTEFRVGLRFDCSGVCYCSQGILNDNIKDIKRLAREIYPSGISDQKRKSTIPTIYGSEIVSAERFNQINDSILDKICTLKLPLNKLLIWLVNLADHISKVKWSNVEDNDFNGLLNLLVNGTFNEAKNYSNKASSVHPKARVLFGQILYILCRSPEVVISEKKSLLKKIQQRFSDASEIRRFGNINGPIPKLWGNWNNLDFSNVEISFGSIPEEATALLYRYVINRISGIIYCGPNYYKYSMVDGLYSLTLAVSAICWLSRVNATIDKRNTYENDDFIKSVMVIDSNNGYGSALNAGSAKLRLSYLKGHCTKIINQYVD